MFGITTVLFRKSTVIREQLGKTKVIFLATEN